MQNLISDNLFIFVFCNLLIIYFYRLGFYFCDLDLNVKMLRHRSILTHSCLLILFIKYLENYYNLVFSVRDINLLSIFIISFSFGIIIHLLYDLKPKSLRGTALLSVPIFNFRFNKFWSICFMLLSIIYLASNNIFLINDWFTYILCNLLMIRTFFINFKKENAKFRIILFLLVYNFIFFIIKNNIILL